MSDTTPTLQIVATESASVKFRAFDTDFGTVQVFKETEVFPFTASEAALAAEFLAALGKPLALSFDVRGIAVSVSITSVPVPVPVSA